MPIVRSIATKALVAGICVGAMVACLDVPSAPSLPAGVVTFTPPSYYSQWWSMDESCSGATGTLANVTWYSVPDSVVIISPDGSHPDGYWSSLGNQIVLHARLINVGSFVRHEMLHALIRVPGHPRSEFLERCAGIVGCDPHCIADADSPPIPPLETPLVPPDSFDVAVAFSSDTVSPSVNGGWVGITITARNRATHAVIASLPIVGGSSGLPLTFELQLDRPDGSASGLSHLELDSEALFFAAGETKRLVFDFAPPQNVLTLAGTYSIIGSFGRHAGPPRPLTVMP